VEIVIGIREQFFVAEEAGRDLSAATVTRDDHAFEIHTRAERFVNRQQCVIDDQEARTRVLDDSGNLVGVKTKIGGVQNTAGGRHAEKRLEMARMVPHHGTHAVAGLQTELGER